MNLQDKMAVIAGGNSGIGPATARLFSDHGARVVIFGRDQASLDQAERQIGNRLVTVQGDVRNLADINRLLLEARGRFGFIDVLIANTGIAKLSPLADFTEVLFDDLGHQLQRSFPHRSEGLPPLRDGASVILIGAADGDKRRLPLQSIYSATKAAVRSLVRTLSAESRPRRIRVIVRSPGMIAILNRDIGLSSDFGDNPPPPSRVRSPLNQHPT